MMRETKHYYSIAILAEDRALMQMLAALFRGMCHSIYLADSEAELIHRLDVTPLDLVIMATTVPFAADGTIEHKVRHIHLCGASIIVLMRSHRHRHTLRLLGAGVDYCMTFPLNLQRLRRVGWELLNNRTRRAE